MLFETKNAFFSRASLSHTEDTPGGELLNTIRQALQHKEPPSKIIGNDKRLYKNDKCEEEVVWSRTAVIWLCGGRIQRQWSFLEDHEEVRAACLTYFEESGTQRLPKRVMPQQRRPALERVLANEPPYVFGPYDRVARSSTKTSVHFESSAEPSMHGVGSGSLLRAVCIIFRSFAEIYSQDGSSHHISIPFLTSNIWPLFPVGFAIEEEPAQCPHYWTTSSQDVEPVLHSFTNPLKPLAPFGIVHKIRNTISGAPLVYQDDLPYPNEDIETFSVVKTGERIIHVENPSPNTPRILFTVDTRLFIVHCYTYAHTPSGGSSIGRKHEGPSLSVPHLFDANQQGLGISRSLSGVGTIGTSNSQVSEADRRDPSRWIVEETPPPQGWRDPQPETPETQSDVHDPLSMFNMPASNFHIDDEDEDEEIIGPECWIQRLASFPISPES